VHELRTKLVLLTLMFGPIDVELLAYFILAVKRMLLNRRDVSTNTYKYRPTMQFRCI